MVVVVCVFPAALPAAAEVLSSAAAQLLSPAAALLYS
jgi:hypothetical protein